jgi:hypothetical protein
MANESKDSYDKDQVNLIDWVLLIAFIWFFAWSSGRDVAETIKKNQIAKVEQTLVSK